MAFTSPKIHVHRKHSEPGIRYLDKDVTIQGHLIKEGFRWDGASSPKLVKALISTFDKSIYSSCLHDKLCRDAKNKFDRMKADQLYRISLVEDDGHTEAEATKGYLGVRVGAWWGSGVNYPHFIKDNIWPLLGIK